MTSTQRGDVGPPSVNADEKTTLTTFLDYLREAVIAKAAGVPDDVARTPGVSSGTSLLGLLRHLTGVEHNWFVWSYRGEGSLRDDELTPDPADTVAGLIDDYRRTVRRCNEIIAACEDLDRPGARTLREAEPPSMRWLLVHLIEETARHAGHADILREQIDGAVGR
ncbi:DinB family protein [Amycolatopsis thermophila]|uniref:Damage-inducible protein DinB n=1 Tax=Amycolatopsis thermophila TaxID=206084 RepID=A0ABU0EMJ9_9PSEU|nr:DinB family protein [Amycolatopsis thermophila]MDQ0376419.1 putative damage-inducible protein DinB [Amycolatopsis thermophila]